MLLASCGSAVEPIPDRPPPAAVHRWSEAELSGATLGDPEIEKTFTRHAYLARIGTSRFARKGEAIEVDSHVLEHAEPFAVVGEGPDVVRIVETYDGARLALWVGRAGFAPTLTSPSELLDPDGAPGDGTHGVWLAAGTQIMVATPEHHSALRSITVDLEELAVTGKVRDAAIGEVFSGPVPDPKTTHGNVYVVGATPIYAAPATTHRLLATTKEGVTVQQLAATGGWVEIELDHAGLRLRGFVRAAAIGTPSNALTDGVIGLGSVFTVSEIDKIVVPSGTCLYDHDEGSVVGVALTTQQRLGHNRSDKPWSHVYVNTRHWGHPLLTIMRAGDSWESCAVH